MGRGQDCSCPDIRVPEYHRSNKLIQIKQLDQPYTDAGSHSRPLNSSTMSQRGATYRRRLLVTLKHCVINGGLMALASLGALFPSSFNLFVIIFTNIKHVNPYFNKNIDGPFSSPFSCSFLPPIGMALDLGICHASDGRWIIWTAPIPSLGKRARWGAGIEGCLSAPSFPTPYIHTRHQAQPFSISYGSDAGVLSQRKPGISPNSLLYLNY